MPLGDAVFVPAGECGKSADELRDLQAAGTLVKRRIQHSGICGWPAKILEGHGVVNFLVAL